MKLLGEDFSGGFFRRLYEPSNPAGLWYALAVAVAQLVRGASQSSWAPTMKFDFSDWTPQPATPKHFPEESWDYGDDRGVGYVGRRLRAHYGEK